MEIYEMTALEVAQKIKNKEITAVDAVERRVNLSACRRSRRY